MTKKPAIPFSQSTTAGNRLAAQYLVCLFALSLLLVVLLLFGELFAIQVLFVFVVTLIPWHHSAAILFFMVQTTLFLHEGRIGIAKIDYNPIVVSVLTLLFIALGDRFRTSWRSLGDGTVSGLWNAVVSPQSTWQPESTSQAAKLEDRTVNSYKYTTVQVLWRIIRLVVVSVGIVFAASIVLLLVGERPQAGSEIRMRPQELRAIMLGLLVLLVGVFATHVLSVIFWRTLSSAQSRIYLKSEFAAWISPETRAITMRRLKLKQRKLKKQ